MKTDNTALETFVGLLSELMRAGTPVRFYPYTSVAMDRIMEVDSPEGNVVYNVLMESCVRVFKMAGITTKHGMIEERQKVKADNKVVFEFKLYAGCPGEYTVFVGFYDGRLSVGRAVKTEHPQEFKLHTEWCGCSKSEFHSYPQDGECSCGMHKHHVHCAKCGGVSQVG